MDGSRRPLQATTARSGMPPAAKLGPLASHSIEGLNQSVW
jgi:hypothetical protein